MCTCYKTNVSKRYQGNQYSSQNVAKGQRPNMENRHTQLCT